MTTTLKKWGNSTAIRIPASVLQAAKFQNHDQVEIREESGRIIIEAVRKVYSLEELLKAMKRNHRPELVDWGSPVGQEIW